MNETDSTRTPGAGQPGKTERPMTDEIRETAMDSAETMRSEARNLGEEAVHQAKDAMEGTREQALAFADQQRRSLEENVAAFAGALESAADSLQSEGKETAASYSRRVAAGIGDVAGWMQGRSLGEVWSQAEDYARRQPAVAFGGAVVAGFLLSRFLMSSTPTANTGTGYGTGSGYRTGTGYGYRPNVQEPTTSPPVGQP